MLTSLKALSKHLEFASEAKSDLQDMVDWDRK